MNLSARFARIAEICLLVLGSASLVWLVAVNNPLLHTAAPRPVARFADPASSVPAVHLASYLQKEAPQSALSADIRADFTHVAHPSGPGSTSSSAPLPTRAVDELLRWTGLNEGGAPAVMRISANLAPELLAVYAARGRGSVGLLLNNRSDRIVEAHVRLHVPAGLYHIERLLFIPTADGATDASLIQNESADFGRENTVDKTYSVGPGRMLVLRCVDEAAQAHIKCEEVLTSLHALSGSAPGAASRIRALLRQTGVADIALRANGRRGGASERSARVHHTLLLLAQAHSVARNLVERRLYNSDRGRAVLQALDSLTVALSDASAALFNLVPQVTLGVPAKNGDREVTVVLENCGERSVSLVKLGLDTAALPASFSCNPADPAMFRSLGPGQTVRAAFKVHTAGATVLTGRQCVGDISYFSAGTPAHLKPTAW